MRKSTLIFAIISIITLVVATFFIIKFIDKKNESAGYKNNYSIALFKQRKAEILHKNEVKIMAFQIDSLRQQLSIKKKGVKDALEIRYLIKDSTIVKTKIVYDSIRQTKSFEFKEPYYLISGEFDKDTAYLYNVFFNDVLTAFIFTEKDTFEKWILNIPKFWKKRNEYYTAKVFSEYKNDTVLVSRQIHVR